MTRLYVKGTPVERAMARIHIREDGCWEWVGAHSHGYGRMYLSPGRYGAPHRVLWEAENGRVPEGTELDHTCRCPGCVNPAHLEAVTHVENVRRGAAAWHERTGRCMRGHDLSVHGYERRDGKSRNCRQCKRERRAGLHAAV